MSVHLHHFYLIDAPAQNAEKFVRDFLAENFENDISPVSTFQSFETFTIEDARELKSVATSAGEKNSPRIVSITASSFTHEALQALLKTFEEPAPHVHFFVTYKGVKNLPDTIRSRAEIIFTNVDDEKIFDAKKFLKKTPALRLKEIGKVVDSHEDDETSGPIRAEAKEIIVAILNELKSDSKKDRKDFKEIAQTLLSFLPYLEGRGANVKMILEHVALVV